MANKIISILFLLCCLVIMPVLSYIASAAKIISDIVSVLNNELDLNDVFK
jgi:hypothetical protein